jgi:hypothetical protein
MRKGFFAICSVLLVLIVSIALLVPGCEGEGEGTIEVVATFDGDSWEGPLDYTLTPGTGSPISGTDVPGSHTADAGTWTCAYVSGGPDGATLVGIAPSETQELSDGGTITFTLNFEIPETDASVTFQSWTIDGEQVPDGSYTVYPPTIIDAEYDVFVAGNSSEWVTVNQTFWLTYHFKGQGESKTWHVANGPVIFTPPVQDLSHECSVDGVIQPVCSTFQAWNCEPVKLDIVATWKQRKGTHYTPTINWLGLGGAGGLSLDILNDVVVPAFEDMAPGVSGNFTVETWACITVEGDVNPANDCCSASPMLLIEFKYE